MLTDRGPVLTPFPLVMFPIPLLTVAPLAFTKTAVKVALAPTLIVAGSALKVTIVGGVGDAMSLAS